MKLKWHPLAIEDQRLIVNYCKANFGIKVAIERKENIRHSAKLLRSHPSLGHVEPLLAGYTSLEYRALQADSHIKIIYSIHADYVYIHLLWDVRQDEEKIKRAIVNRYHESQEEFRYQVNEDMVEYE